MGVRALTVVGLLAALACEKVPIVDIGASFSLADAAWFSQEQTLFLFYTVEARQGLGEHSQIEVTYRTDELVVPWTSLGDLAQVHPHVAVDCGPTTRCGSASLAVTAPPREVALRLRYHRDGALALETPVQPHFVLDGPPHTHRSLLVYGVFDASNTRVQWRARHQFPSLRNEEAERLGLRRTFTISDQRYGGPAPALGDNRHGYAFAPACPAEWVPLAEEPFATSARARFSPGALPMEASSAPVVCATATVSDALGPFVAVSLARKNPQVRAAFPVLRSPVTRNTSVGFLLRPCARSISDPHLAMQRQRLLLDGAEEVCLDRWEDPSFADQLAARLLARLETERSTGADLVLTLALHHDEGTGRLAAVIEAALVKVLVPEAGRGSPRISGAFVLDSYAHTLATPALRRLVLWCPANLDGGRLDRIPDESQRSCPLVSDVPDLHLGPFRFNTLPILPTREQYVDFVGRYSADQAGQMKALTFSAPRRTALSEDLLVEPYGVVTFFNDEVLSASPTDAFSYCDSGEGDQPRVVARGAVSRAPVLLSALPEAHAAMPEPSYALGLFWDFSFLSRVQYEVQLAGAAKVATFTVPFGVASTTTEPYGAEQWERGEFPLAQRLAQCTRYCEHPTFKTSGEYEPETTFREGYRDRCYAPQYPVDDGGGFPSDP